MDQGAYFDVKRHRVMTQTPQPLSVELGYASAAGHRGGRLRRRVRSGRSRPPRRLIVKSRLSFPYEAAYVVPNAYIGACC